jgi:hypothetical protein
MFLIERFAFMDRKHPDEKRAKASMNRKIIIVSEHFIDCALLLLCICLIVSGCQSRDEKLRLSSIKMEITTLDTEIIRAEMEDMSI